MALKNNKMIKTEEQFDHVVSLCREIFVKKTKDYGTAWRILRPSSITDQIYIKANRIRTLEIKGEGESKVGDGIHDEFVAIVNYGIMGIVQLEKGHAEEADLDAEEAIRLYDAHMAVSKELMLKKNHDYDEAWRGMRISSYTDLILQKLQRTKMIENNKGKTIMSEGIDANYLDMVNYSIFALIKMEFGES